MAQLDNIPAMLQSGEYVVRKEAVDKLGKDTMDMINNADRLGYMGGGLVPQGEHGHSAIDELLALNTLANQRSVDMTRGSAMMNKGGMAKKKMYGYENGGSIPSNLASYISQMQAIPDMGIRRNEPLSYLDSALERLLERQESIPDIYKQIGIDELNELEKKLGYSGEVEGSKRRRRFKSVKGYPDYLSTISALEGDLSALKYLRDKILRQDIKKQFAARQMDLGGGERTGLQEVTVGRAPELISNLGNVMNFIYDPKTGESKRSRNIPIERPVSFDFDVDYISSLIKEIEEREKSGEGTIYGEYFQQGGMAKKKKNAYRDGGLGVQDKLAMAMDEFKDIEKMLSYATPSEYLMPKSQRDMLDLLQESGQVDVEKALEALDLIQRRYQEGSVGFHMPRYQNGGVASYQDGGYSPSDSIQQYYETFGYEPTDEKNKKQFEKLYAYDPSEALGDIGELRTDISRQLGTATTDTASYGRGFGAFGGRQRSMGDIRRRAEETYGTGATDIIETSRAESEADALQFLAGLQQSDADMRQFTVDPEDNPVSELPTTNQGPVFYNGSTWIWSEEEGQYVQS